MQKLANRLGLRADPTIFFVSAGLSLIFVLLLVAAPGPIGSAFVTGRAWIVTNLGWFFILGVNVWLGFLIYAAMSRYGHIRLGPRLAAGLLQPVVVHHAVRRRHRHGADVLERPDGGGDAVDRRRSGQRSPPALFL